jgi:NUMOD3 motif
MSKRSHPPIKIYLRGSDLICFDRSIEEFRLKYGNRYELIDTIKDSRNLDDIIPRHCRTYSVEDVIFDCHKEKRWGWRYMTDQEKSELVNAIREYRTGRPWEDEVKEKISASRKGVGNFIGKRHSPTSKAMIAISRYGKSRVEGLRWAYNSDTEKEIRCKELPEGYRWGRSPEFKDAFKK